MNNGSEWYRRIARQGRNLVAHLMTAADELERREREMGFAESEIVKAVEAYERAVIERNETDAVLQKLRDILRRTAIAIKGPEDGVTSHSFHDLPELVAGLKQSHSQGVDPAPARRMTPGELWRACGSPHDGDDGRED